MDITIIAILVLIIVYQAIEKWSDRKVAMEREKELLNRIMARNYQEYAKLESKEMRVVKVDDLLKEQEEQGIPIY